MITYGKTIFATYTFSRDRLLDDAWKQTSNDFNRCIQRIRRLHNHEVQYLRTIEMHNDGYPHIHALLRFNTVLTITNGKWVDRKLYRRWKDTWKRGHSDYQVPRSRQNSLAYVLKYAAKESGVNVWKHYYRHLGVNFATPQPSSLKKPRKVTDCVKTVSPLMLQCRKFKIKQTSWSRKFFNSLLNN